MCFELSCGVEELISVRQISWTLLLTLITINIKIQIGVES